MPFGRMTLRRKERLEQVMDFLIERVNRHPDLTSITTLPTSPTPSSGGEHLCDARAGGRPIAARACPGRPLPRGPESVRSGRVLFLKSWNRSTAASAPPRSGRCGQHRAYRGLARLTRPTKLDEILAYKATIAFRRRSCAIGGSPAIGGDREVWRDSPSWARQGRAEREPPRYRSAHRRRPRQAAGRRARRRRKAVSKSSRRATSLGTASTGTGEKQSPNGGSTTARARSRTNS